MRGPRPRSDAIDLYELRVVIFEVADTLLQRTVEPSDHDNQHHRAVSGGQGLPFEGAQRWSVKGAAISEHGAADHDAIPIRSAGQQDTCRTG